MFCFRLLSIPELLDSFLGRSTAYMVPRLLNFYHDEANIFSSLRRRDSLAPLLGLLIALYVVYFVLTSVGLLRRDVARSLIISSLSDMDSKLL